MTISISWVKEIAKCDKNLQTPSQCQFRSKNSHIGRRAPISFFKRTRVASGPTGQYMNSCYLNLCRVHEGIQWRRWAESTSGHEAMQASSRRRGDCLLRILAFLYALLRHVVHKQGKVWSPVTAAHATNVSCRHAQFTSIPTHLPPHTHHRALSPYLL